MTQKELPKIWKDLHQQLLKRYLSISTFTDYIVLDFSNQPLDVLDAINSLAKEKPYISRMEKKSIAVKLDSLKDFEKALIEKGYRIPYLMDEINRYW